MILSRRLRALGTMLLLAKHLDIGPTEFVVHSLRRVDARKAGTHHGIALGSSHGFKHCFSRLRM